jgi:hypothetical protein
LQELIVNIYKKHPTQHHIHSAVGVMNYKFQVSRNEERTPDYNSITSKVIKKCIAAAVEGYKQWPMILKSENLSKEAKQQPLEVQWWLPEEQEQEQAPSSEESGGAIKYFN